MDELEKATETCRRVKHRSNSHRCGAIRFDKKPAVRGSTTDCGPWAHPTQADTGSTAGTLAAAEGLRFT